MVSGNILWNNCAFVAAEGSVRRAYDKDTGSQYVIVNLVAAIPTLTEFENKVLNTQNWNWETVRDEPRKHFLPTLSLSY